MEQLPQLSLDLVRKLDEMFPERCPSKSDSERDIWIYSGKRELVRFLVSLTETSSPFGET